MNIWSRLNLTVLWYFSCRSVASCRSVSVMSSIAELTIWTLFMLHSFSRGRQIFILKLYFHYRLCDGYKFAHATLSSFGHIRHRPMSSALTEW
ncbi:hypothetical protein BDV35DRAFT_118003 [Aspergillus flavus]|uniref:Secreted protein n=1 Tax=Aspergillus flavus TaxID=5059 RepID=A0A5N6GGN5_ASPFL|nr:hypothetical protein BDV35DRAFT_118003 [Aspergillus flavus]